MPGRLTFVLGFECDRNLVLAKALSAIRNNHKREFEVVIMIAVVTEVGSEVAHRVTPALATVRLSNRACRFPAHGFHEDTSFRDAQEGVDGDRVMRPGLTVTATRFINE